MINTLELKVAFQGAPGAFSHRAVQLFAQDMSMLDKLNYVSCRSFDEIYETILARKCTHGVVPLENSSVGSIVANYDLLWKNPVSIVGEVYLPVHHNLIGFAGTDIDSIVQVLSHPVALDQCRQFLKSVPGAKAVSYWDTSASAFHVKETGDPTMAAIASEFAAAETGLALLKRNIEDHSGNRTRFGVITHSENVTDLDCPAAPFKISCVVELTHQAGALASLLRNLAILGVNLTKIESRPIPETPWHYRFFLDVEIPFDEVADAVTDAIARLSETHKILGRYKPWKEPTF
jgi:prephenate dehydratase